MLYSFILIKIEASLHGNRNSTLSVEKPISSSTRTNQFDAKNVEEGKNYAISLISINKSFFFLFSFWWKDKRITSWINFSLGEHSIAEQKSHNDDPELNYFYQNDIYHFRALSFSPGAISGYFFLSYFEVFVCAFLACYTRHWNLFFLLSIHWWFYYSPNDRKFWKTLIITLFIISHFPLVDFVGCAFFL